MVSKNDLLAELSALKSQFISTEALIHDNNENTDKTAKHLSLLETQCLDLKSQLVSLEKNLQSYQKSTDKLGDRITELEKQIADRLDRLDKKEEATRRNGAEAVWAEVFHDTIQNSTWLWDKTFSPGRWGLGYSALYALYRVLNEFRPKNILELGLGQSTRMISQYAASDREVCHTVVEHDPEWISFFKNDFTMAENSRIVQLEREMVPYAGTEVRRFGGFAETFGGERFDLILIDAPLGGDMPKCARMDILDILPECLCEKFVILMDDAERSGEKYTINKIQECLTQSGIQFRKGTYGGQKDTVLLCAEALGFLGTM